MDPNDGAVVTEVELSYVDLLQVVIGYVDDHSDLSIVPALNGKWLGNKRKRVKLEKLITVLSIEDSRLLYNKKIYVPRNALSFILQIVHDSKIGVHFKFAKPKSRLCHFY